MAVAFFAGFGGNRRMPVYVPQELLALRLKCPVASCAEEFPIPFKERQQQPIGGDGDRSHDESTFRRSSGEARRDCFRSREIYFTRCTPIYHDTRCQIHS